MTHVTAGHRWFTWLCARDGLDPVAAFRQAVQTHFWGALKGPFNVADRAKAGLSPAFYENLQGQATVLGVPPANAPAVSSGSNMQEASQSAVAPIEARPNANAGSGTLSFDGDKQQITEMVPDAGQPTTHIGYA